jgi:hypothetical protein
MIRSGVGSRLLGTVYSRRSSPPPSISTDSPRSGRQLPSETRYTGFQGPVRDATTDQERPSLWISDIAQAEHAWRITTISSCSRAAKPVATARWIRTASGEWLPGLRPGKLVIMHATIPTHCLYGIEALPADVIVGPGDVQVVERGTGRVLTTRQACMQAGLATLGRRRSAPETMSTRQFPLFYPLSPA